jgi:hypothetical protein
MSRTAKILLTIGVSLVVIAAGLAGIAALLWARHGRALLDAGSKQYDEGAAYGKGTDEQGCLDQAVARYKASSGVAGSMQAGIFVRACWKTSQPTPGFCDTVPAPMDVFRGVRWQREQTQKAGIDEQIGGQIFGQLRGYCAEKPGR